MVVAVDFAVVVLVVVLFAVVVVVIVVVVACVDISLQIGSFGGQQKHDSTGLVVKLPVSWQFCHDGENRRSCRHDCCCF